MTNDQGVFPACQNEALWSLCSAMCDGTIDERGLARLRAFWKQTRPVAYSVPCTCG